MRRRAPLITGAVLLLITALALIDLATRPPLLPGYARVRAAWQPSEAWLEDRHGVLIDSERVNFAARRLAWTPLGAVAPSATAAILAAEDKRFYAHGGVDWRALAAALVTRARGGRARGASTLTMQLAGMLSPRLAAPGARGVFDKLRQMRAAWAIEAEWSKAQILEAYLNLAGFRGEAQGVGAAALGLFGKTPEALGRDEGLLLAALLPDPAAPPARIGARACRLARAAPGGGEGAPCQRLVALAWAMLGPARSLQLDPGLAPHLAQHLLTRPGLRLRTTLDARVQRLALAALRRQLAALGARARDGAVVVADTQSGEVLAYVGGAGNASTARAVDGASAYRQAGSTLKPFLYAQALERGYLTPASILDDSPVQLDTASGLYVPQNYDRAFKGPVSARTALAGSLNVPAVRTLLLVGVAPFRDRLWALGYHGLVEEGDYYGFSLALGSAEVTLFEQVAAYRALARGGRWAPLRLEAGAPAPADQPVTSAQAAWLVSDMLADPNARAITFGLDSALRLPFWAAVKTGTSKALRDNWCIGFTDRFTVGVWIGNAEGDPMRAVSGTSGAAPVWRDVMRALHAGMPGRAPPRPAGIVARQVRFAGDLEPARRDYFLAGTDQPIVAPAPPGAHRPRITSPVSGSIYALDGDIPPDQQRVAVTVAGAAADHRLWLDGRLLAAPLFPPIPGRHRLRLADAQGRVVDQVAFTVR